MGFQISELFSRAVGDWGVWHLSLPTMRQGSISEQAWLLEHWEQRCLSLPLVSFSGAYLFKATFVYLWDANEDQIDMIRFSHTSKPGWASPLDFSISFKRKLKNEFFKSPNLNSFYSYSVTRMLQSEESSKQTNKQKQAQNIWVLFLLLPLVAFSWLPALPKV